MKLAEPSDYDYYHTHVDSKFGLQFVDRVILDLHFHSVLDFGCGRGHCMARLASRGKFTVGFDISEKAVNTAVYPTVVLGGYWALPSIPDRSVDLVFCADVLEHMQEAEAISAIHEFERIARRYIVASICFRPSVSLPEFQWHRTIKPREWWESHFTLTKVPGWESDGEPNLFVYKR